MPEETGLKQYARNDAILASDLNATNRRVEELSRQLNALQRFLENNVIHSAHVRVDSDAPTGGCYYGMSARGPNIPPQATTPIGDSTLGVFASDVDTLIINLQELGQSTHALTSANNDVTEFVGRYIGRNADRLYVVLINGVAMKDNCG